jgi:hypothetical protein
VKHGLGQGGQKEGFRLVGIHLEDFGGWLVDGTVVNDWNLCSGKTLFWSREGF